MTLTSALKDNNLDIILEAALAEDMPNGDITTSLIGNPHDTQTAKLISKDTGLFFGTKIITHIARLRDPSIKIKLNVKDSDSIIPNQTIAILTGPVSSLLAIERVMLNYIQRLSGISTITRKFISALNNKNIQIVDTRKTTPLMRALEKEAVIAGGGHNHRHSLSDMILLKENHLAALKKPSRLNQLLKTHKEKHPHIQIEVEVETTEELETLDLTEVDIIMLDNFKLDDIQKAKDICIAKHYKAKLEVSGNITLENIKGYKELPIDRIAIGCLTHSVKALDLSLLID